MKNNILILLIIAFTNLFGTAEDHISLIQSLIDKSEILEANEKFQTAIIKYNANAGLYFIGGTVAVKLDKLDEANKHFIKAIELDNKNEYYRLEQEKLSELKNGMTNARKTYDSGSVDEAIIEYKKLSTSFSKNAIVFYNLGRVYKVNEEYNLAVKNYKMAKEINPYESKYSLAITAIAQEMAKTGDKEYRCQEFESAIEYYKNAIEYSPDYTTAYFKLARTYFKMRDYENTKNYLEKNLEVDPNQEQSEKMLGDIYRSTGESDQAIEHYNLAISINGNYHQAYYSLGTTLLSNGDLKNAKIALQSAIQLDSNYAKAYGALGTVEQELGEIDSAINNFIQATSLDAKSYKIHYRLASVYNIQKQYENAKQSAKKCLNIKRNYAPAYFELGVSEKALGNKVAAIDSFEKASKDKNWRKSAQFELDMLSKGF
ncbi:MAG: tetratricopeptide repeat protein [Candidatus Marinimicrobia bacterium]|nr:tetratricopeptide repeat protein [Candidatus Neomarinimicrobiota bacterium]